jgi:hypothetical protein
MTKPTVQTFRIFPCEQYLCGGTRLHREHRTDRNGVAQPAAAFDRGYAYPLIALAAKYLRGLACTVEKGLEDRSGRGEQSVLARSRRELGEAGTEHEAPVRVAKDETVALQRDGETMCRWSGEVRRRDELAQCGRTGFESIQYLYGFVKNPDTGMNLGVIYGGDGNGGYCHGIFGVVPPILGHFWEGFAEGHNSDYAISYCEMQKSRNWLTLHTRCKAQQH